MKAWLLRDCIGPSDYMKLEFLCDQRDMRQSVQLSIT